MPRARTDVRQITVDIVAAVAAVRERITPTDARALEDWATVETFIAIALRVFAQTNPSKIRDAAMTEEIKARMDGRGVIE